MWLRIFLSVKLLLVIFVASSSSQNAAPSSSPSHISLPRHDAVDHIENIETDATQVVITTTKQGPPENLKIHIELVDIAENKKVNPVDLSGLWLTITRGRYTIPFLRPDTWYGVRFKSENEIDGRKIIHEDERLIKTNARDPMDAYPHLATLPPPVGIMGFPPHQPPPVIGMGIGGFGHVETSTLGLFEQQPHHGEGENTNSNHPKENHGTISPHHPPSLIGGAFAGVASAAEHGNGSPSHQNQNQKNGSKNKEPNTDDNFLDVKTHRSLDGVENYESLYVTVSWNDKEGRNNKTTGLVKLWVICENTETKEDISLKGDEDSVTIEITVSTAMDQKYEIEEMDKEKHQIKAHITPLKCHKICWTSDLMLSSEFGDFKKHLADECRGIEGTTSTTYLRDLKKVSVVENNLSINELIVETEVAETEYGMVTLILTKLGGNDTEEERKSFDTTTSNGKFVVPLEDDAIYAVKYEYVKNRPFHYTSKTQFLVESPAPNSTKPSIPLADFSVMPKTFDYKHDKPDSALKPEPPYILIARSDLYKNHELVVDIDPFCNENRTRFHLEDRYPEHQVDAVNFLCGIQPKMYFCDHNSTYKSCDSTLCFSTSVLIGDDLYTAESRCLNATQHFPPLVSMCRSTFGTNLLVYIITIFISIMFVYQ